MENFLRETCRFQNNRGQMGSPEAKIPTFYLFLGVAFERLLGKGPQMRKSQYHHAKLQLVRWREILNRTNKKKERIKKQQTVYPPRSYVVVSYGGSPT